MSEADVPSDWLTLYEAGYLDFVDVIRQISAPEILGPLAARWAGDARLNARGLLRAYLDQPLNAFGHEVLIKRLFKELERRSDDEALAWMMPALDRLIDRRLQLIRRNEQVVVDTHEQAQQLARQWAASGKKSARTWKIGKNQYVVVARVREPGRVVPYGTSMPGLKPRRVWLYHSKLKKYVAELVPEWQVRLGLARDAEQYDSQRDPVEYADALARFRLFSVSTRHYLRRRLWRYLRRLARSGEPARYLSLASQALVLYTDDDFETPQSALDRWCLLHVTQGASPTLVARSSGWEALGELPDKPEPVFAELWLSSPSALVSIAERARSAFVRDWAIQMLESVAVEPTDFLSLDDVRRLTQHPEPAVSDLGLRYLDKIPGGIAFAARNWRELLLTAPDDEAERWSLAIEAVAAAGALDSATRIELAQLPCETVARKHWDWVRNEKLPIEQLQPLGHAWCDAVRAEALCEVQDRLPSFQPERSDRKRFVDWAHDWMLAGFQNTREHGLELFVRASNEGEAQFEDWLPFANGVATECSPELVRRLQPRHPEHENKRTRLVDRLPLDVLLPIWESALADETTYSQDRLGRIVQQVRRKLERGDIEPHRVLSILAMGVRSRSKSVRHSAVAVLTSLRSRRPALEPIIAEVVPELHWNG